MFILIPLFLLLITAFAILLLRILPKMSSFAWPIAVIGSFLAWISSFLVLLRFPNSVVISSWQPQTIFTSSPALLVDSYNFSYIVALSAFALVIILLLSANMGAVTPEAWAGILLISAIALASVMAGNMLTFVIAWGLLDFIETANYLRIANTQRQNENVVIAFAFRMLGTWLVVWAASLGTAPESTAAFASLPNSAIALILLGVTIRVIAQASFSSHTSVAVLVKSYNPALSLVSIAATLAILARIPVGNFDPLWVTALLVIASFIVVVTAFVFLRAKDSLFVQPSWIIAFASLSVAAALRGNPAGSAAWGSALVFSGGVIFLTSYYRRWLVAILLASVFIISTLPFSLTAVGWNQRPEISRLPFIFFIPGHAMLLAGYLRAILRTSIVSMDNQPAWVQVFYPAGMLILILTGFATGVIGFEGARQLGAWLPALISVILCTLLMVLLIKLSVPEPPQLSARIVRPPLAVVEWVRNFVGWTYRFLGRTTGTLARTLEGDGGFLWAILLLVLLISILQSFYQ